MSVSRKSKFWIWFSGSILAVGILLLGWHFYTARQGAREAQAQIRQGHLTLYTFGLRDFDKSYDPDTGLPLEGIAGCFADDSIDQRAETHNEYIENWIAEGNIPPNSLRAYNKLIADPFSEIAGANFVNLTAEKPVDLNNFKIIYSIFNGQSGDYHNITVKSHSFDWSHTIGLDDDRNFRAAVIADGRILAITHQAECMVVNKVAFKGKAYQSIQLFDLPTGISLNRVTKEVGKSE